MATMATIPNDVKPQVPSISIGMSPLIAFQPSDGHQFLVESVDEPTQEGRTGTLNEVAGDCGFGSPHSPRPLSRDAPTRAHEREAVSASLFDRTFLPEFTLAEHQAADESRRRGNSAPALVDWTSKEANAVSISPRTYISNSMSQFRLLTQVPSTLR